MDDSILMIVSSTLEKLFFSNLSLKKESLKKLLLKGLFPNKLENISLGF